MDGIGDVIRFLFVLFVIAIILIWWYSVCGDVFTKSVLEVPAFCVSK